MASGYTSGDNHLDFTGLLPLQIAKRGTSAKNQLENLRKLSATHETQRQAVKRKASQLSTISNESYQVRTAAAEDLLEAVVQERKTIAEIQNAQIICLKADFEAKKIEKSEYEKEMREVYVKQSKLFAGDITIKRQRGRVLGHIQQVILKDAQNEALMTKSLAELFYNILCHKHIGRGQKQHSWKQELVAWYEFQPNGRDTKVWCPVTKTWMKWERRKAAHLAPYQLGPETISDLFGGNGEELMWSMENGIIWDRDIEDAFSAYDFCLLLVVRPGLPDEFKFVLMNESERDTLIGSGLTYGQLDGTILEFRPGNPHRPGKKFLYFHYFMCVYKAMKEFQPGWEDLRQKTTTGQLWATPGPYLRDSMLKKLALCIGDVEFASELTEGKHV